MECFTLERSFSSLQRLSLFNCGEAARSCIDDNFIVGRSHLNVLSVQYSFQERVPIVCVVFSVTSSRVVAVMREGGREELSSQRSGHLTTKAKTEEFETRYMQCD